MVLIFLQAFMLCGSFCLFLKRKEHDVLPPPEAFVDKRFEQCKSSLGCVDDDSGARDAHTFCWLGVWAWCAVGPDGVVLEPKVDPMKPGAGATIEIQAAESKAA